MSLGHEEGHSFVSVDDLEPRLPPRLSRYPAPFDFPEKPVLQVPDVSLIFDSVIIPADSSLLPGNTPKQNANSSQTSFGRVTPSSKNSSGMVATTSPAVGMNSRNSEPSLANNSLNSTSHGISSSMDKTNSGQFIGADCNVIMELQSQRETITRMEEKLDKIMQFQDEFLSQVFRRGALISSQVQTDQAFTKKLTRRSQPKTTTTRTTNISETDSPILTPKHQHQHHNNKNKHENGGQFERILTERVHNNNNESLSAMRLPSLTLNAPSDLFSAASGIKSLHLQDFEDDSSHSGSGELFCSDCSSSDEDDNSDKPVIKVKPPGQGVLTNGNRILTDAAHQTLPGVNLWKPSPQPSPHAFENNTERTGSPFSNGNRISSGRHHNQHRFKSTPGSNFHSPVQKYPNPDELRGFNAIQTNGPTGPTETTVYGMTPSNLSFATKEYLHRYGLVTQQQSPHRQSPNQNDAPRQSQPPHKKYANRHEGDRILNITEIKNQPKFL